MIPEEQRRAPRIARAFIARYRWLEGGTANWLVSPLRDLSIGGARFLCEQTFPVGAELEVQLLLPISKNPIPVQARVAWTKPARLGMTDTGVTFHVGEGAIQQVLNEAVAQFLNRGGQR